jgi:hypothetical protein
MTSPSFDITDDVKKPVKPMISSCFYYWEDHFPELQVLLDQFDIIENEAKHIGNVSVIFRHLHTS